MATPLKSTSIFLIYDVAYKAFLPHSASLPQGNLKTSQGRAIIDSDAPQMRNDGGGKNDVAID